MKNRRQTFMLVPGDFNFTERIIQFSQKSTQIVTIKLSLRLTNYALLHKDVWGSGCIDSSFRDLGTSWS
jgi:hypothetical protein